MYSLYLRLVSITIELTLRFYYQTRENQGRIRGGKLVIKKMATKGGRIDFMFLGPPYPTAGSATARIPQRRMGRHSSTRSNIQLCQNFRKTA